MKNRKSVEVPILMPESCTDVFVSMREIIKAMRMKKAELCFQKYEKFPIEDACLLIAALALFTRRDADELFLNSKDVYEPSMVGCIYRYMYIGMSMGVVKTGFSDIDIEYDRMRIDGNKYCPKTMSLCDEHDVMCDLHQRIACKHFVELSTKRCEKCQQYEKRIRPDLIIHNRNSKPGEGNGLFVEFKRNDVVDIDGDEIKVSYSTCPMGILNYRGGAFVKLSKEKQRAEFYYRSRPIMKVDVMMDKIVIN